MASADRRNAAQKTAAHLIAMGYPHGKRASHPSHNNWPVNRAGSAAYRRLQDAQMRRYGGTIQVQRSNWHPFNPAA